MLKKKKTELVSIISTKETRHHFLQDLLYCHRYRYHFEKVFSNNFFPHFIIKKDKV